MPALSAPRASAPSIIASAMRSLYEPVGLKYSSLTKTSALVAGASRRSRTTGVRPMAARTESTGAGEAIPRVYVPAFDAASRDLPRYTALMRMTTMAELDRYAARSLDCVLVLVRIAVLRARSAQKDTVNQPRALRDIKG